MCLIARCSWVGVITRDAHCDRPDSPSPTSRSTSRRLRPGPGAERLDAAAVGHRQLADLEKPVDEQPEVRARSGAAPPRHAARTVTPRPSSSAMTARIDAGDRVPFSSLATVCDPTGAPPSRYDSTNLPEDLLRALVEFAQRADALVPCRFLHRAFFATPIGPRRAGSPASLTRLPGPRGGGVRTNATGSNAPASDPGAPCAADVPAGLPSVAHR